MLGGRAERESPVELGAGGAQADPPLPARGKSDREGSIARARKGSPSVPFLTVFSSPALELFHTRYSFRPLHSCPALNLHMSSLLDSSIGAFVSGGECGGGADEREREEADCCCGRVAS